MGWTVSSTYTKSPDVAKDAKNCTNVDQATSEGRRRATNGDANITITARDGSSYSRR